MKKTILITGGAGFIGSNLVHHLYNKYPESKLLVLDALTYAGNIENLPLDPRKPSDRVEFWYGNVRNGTLVERLVSKSNIVIHLAAETHVTRSIFDNFHFFETDVLGTQVVSNAVLEHRKSVERFIHISTSEVYGTAEGETMEEDSHPLNPLSPYAAAKAGADRLVYSYWATYKLPATIIRPFNNYGARQHLEKAIPRFITSCILNEPITVHGDGSAMRDWLYVGDTVRGIEAAMTAPLEKVQGQTFNLGTGGSKSVGEIADSIVRLMKAPPSLIQKIGDRPGQVFRHTADIKKTTKVLGWKPEMSFEDGLKATIDWYRANRPWWEKQIYMRAVPIITDAGKPAMH